MKCDVAREALSARIDGEREPVPSARVDEHLEECAECCAWYVRAGSHTRRLRVSSATAIPNLAGSVLDALDVTDAYLPANRWRRAQAWSYRIGTARIVLLLAGLAAGVVAIASFAGVEFGMATGHVSNESAAAELALGIAMIASVLIPRLLPGVAAVLALYALILLGVVIADSVAGMVTAARVLSHLPVLVGAIAAGAAWRIEVPDSPRPREAAAGAPDELRLPDHATLGIRRSHIRPTDDSAA